jgi:hypothetical protein
VSVLFRGGIPPGYGEAKSAVARRTRPLIQDYELSSEAQDELFDIWQQIAADSFDLATRLEDEFLD